MAAKIIPLEKEKKSIRKLVSDAFETNLSHLNPQVLHCLKKEVEKLLEKHFTGDPPEMTIKLPPDLTEEQFLQIKTNFNEAFHNHNEQAIQRTNSIFLDLYHSRLEYCELKYGHQDQD